MGPDRIGIGVIHPLRIARAGRAGLFAAAYGLALAAWAAAQPAPLQPVHTWECPARGVVTDVAMSPDENRVAFASIEALPSTRPGEGRFQEVLRVVNFRNACRLVEPGQAATPAPPRQGDLPRALFDLQFSGDGLMLAYGDGSAVYVVRTADLKRLWKFEIPISDHGTVIPALALARNVHLAAVLARPFRLPPPASGPRLLKRPEFLNLLRIYDLDTGQVRADVKIGGAVRAVDVALSADGSRAAVVLRPAQVEDAAIPDFMVVDTASGQLLQAVHAGVNGPVAPATSSAVWSLDGAGDYYNRTFRLIDLQDAQVVRSIDRPAQRVPACLATSANGLYLASTLWHPSAMVPDVFVLGRMTPAPVDLAVWDTRSGALVGQVASVASTAVKLSASGRFLLAGTRIFEFDFAPQSNRGGH